jgi:hypothetical protein
VKGLKSAAVVWVLSILASPSFAQEILSVDASQVEVGEPFQLTLELEDPTAFDPGTPDLDDSWVLLDQATTPTSGGVRFTWSLVSLEPGSRLVSFLPGEDLAEVPEPVRLRIVGVLRDDESEPRPLPGLPADFGASLAIEEGWALWQFALVGFCIFQALAILVVVLVIRRRRGPSVAAQPSAIERFDAQVAEGAEVSERHHLWAQLLRESVDGRSGKRRVSLTEGEWLQAISDQDGIGGELFDGIKRALDDCERVRFAGERPSSFAAEELQRQVRALLVEVGQRRGQSENEGQVA